MAMFDEKFSFDTPRSPSLNSSTDPDSSRSVSPCTTSAPFSPPAFSVADLAAQFATQRIQRDSQICYDSCEAYANNDDDAAWCIPTADESENDSLRRSQPFPQRPHSPSRRIQRQVNTRLLCSVSHRRDIQALVTQMIQEEDQCCIAPNMPSIQPELEEDEGYDSSDDPMTESSRRSSIATTCSSLGIRRVSELLVGHSSINRQVRVQKESRQRRRTKHKRS